MCFFGNKGTNENCFDCIYLLQKIFIYVIYEKRLLAIKGYFIDFQ